MHLTQTVSALFGVLILSTAVMCQETEGEFKRGSDEHKFNKRETHAHHHYHNSPAPAPAPIANVAPAAGRGGGMFGGGMAQNVATGTLMAGGAAFAGTAGHIAAENMFGDKKDDKADKEDSSDDHHRETSQSSPLQQPQPITQTQPAFQIQPIQQHPQPVEQYQAEPVYTAVSQPQSGVEYQQVPYIPLSYLYPTQNNNPYAVPLTGTLNTGAVSPNVVRSPFNSAGPSIYSASTPMYSA